MDSVTIKLEGGPAHGEVYAVPAGKTEFCLQSYNYYSAQHIHHKYQVSDALGTDGILKAEYQGDNCCEHERNGVY